MITSCKMCGRGFEARDRRKKYCESCAAARRRMFNNADVAALRERARMQRLAEQEELAGLRTENELLRERVIELEAMLGGGA